MDPFLTRLAAATQVPLALVARLLAAVLFVMAGMSIVMDMSAFSAKLAGDGLPVWLTGFVFWFVLLSGLGLALGLQTRLLGLAMALFTIASGIIDYGPMRHPTDMMFLLKNISLTGGYLMFFLYGGGRWSVDGMVARYRAAHPDQA